MKQEYKEPEVEVVRFEMSDVITGSTCDTELTQICTNQQ